MGKSLGITVVQGIRDARSRRRFTAQLLLVAALGACGPAQPAGPGPSATAPASRAPSGTEAPGAGPANFGTAPERRFIQVGGTGGEQFTDGQFRYLAANFDYVIFTKFHGGFDISAQHEAAKHLVGLNPGIKVFPYISTKYWFFRNRWGGEPFREEWLLKDSRDEVIYRSRKEDDLGKVAYVDLANPEYRRWALDTMRSWLAAAPYAGISFDAAEPIGDYESREIARWDRLIGADRVAAYNEGMRTLLRDTKKLLGADREVIFNGIAPNTTRGPDRNLDLLEITDGAMDERFCLDIRGGVHSIDDDLNLMATTTDRKLFMHTNYPADSLGAGVRPAYGRMCLGAFLMGWEPGKSYFRFGDDYTADQLSNDLPEMSAPVGEPRGPYREESGMLVRDFANGRVWVNLENDEQTLTAEGSFLRVGPDGTLEPGTEGSELEVPAHDAAFLLREAPPPA